MLKVGDYIFVHGSLARGGASDLCKQTTVQFIEPDAINGSLADFGFLQEKRPVMLLPNDPSYARDWVAWLPYINGDVFRVRHASIIALLTAFCRCPADTDVVEVVTRCQRPVHVFTHKLVGEIT